MSQKPKHFNFVYFPNGTGEMKRISVSKFWTKFLACCFFIGIGLTSAAAVQLIKFRRISEDNARLNVENSSIRAEATLLIGKLEEVQSNLKKVGKYSQAMREVSENVRSKKIPKPTLPIRPQGAFQRFTANIGPLSPEEYLLTKNSNQSEALKSIKIQGLEFKKIFAALSNINAQSATQASEMEGLLSTLTAYRMRMAVTPSIFPTKGYLSSNFGIRESPINGQTRMHQGLDIAAPTGTPIVSAADGTVSRTGYADDYGHFVEVSHGHGVTTRYAHASVVIATRGQKVTKGQLIARVGATGRTTGPHLHYEIISGGRKINPAPFLSINK